MRVEVTRDERDLLVSILTTYLGDLKEEVYKTEAVEFKTALKEREALLLAVIEKVRRAS